MANTENIEVDCCGATDRGRVRRRNEDQFLVARLDKSMLVQQTSLSIDDQTRLKGGFRGWLMVVADGMGGAAAGERASYVAVSTLTRYVLDTMSWFFRLDRNDEDLAGELREGLERCQGALERDPHGARGMGTTVTMAYVLWPRLYVVHAGDSRCYVQRRGELIQLTRDHTMAQQLVEQGAVSPREAERSPMAHVLWNAVVADGSADLAPEVRRARLEPGDTLLLCSDGLTKHVDDGAIARALAGGASSEEVCARLVAAANEAGGSDNITVVTARFVPKGEP